MLPSVYSTAWSKEATVCTDVPAAVKVTSRAVRFARTMTSARAGAEVPSSNNKTAVSLVLTGGPLAAGGKSQRQNGDWYGAAGILRSYLPGGMGQAAGVWYKCFTCPFRAIRLRPCPLRSKLTQPRHRIPLAR